MSTRLKHVTLYWLPLLVYCLVIYIQSGYPPPETLPSFNFSDKLIHFAAYALMGILFYRAYQTLSFRNNRHLLLALSMVSASLYGISDEIHQHFVPYREADFFDAAADILGAVCGVYGYQYWQLRKRKTDTEMQMPDVRR